MTTSRRSSARIDALIEEADRAGVKVGVCFQDRLTPDLVEMKATIDEGRLGTPVFASGRVKWYRPPEYYAESRWRGTWRLDGGGVLMNQAIHTIDTLFWMFGPVARVSGHVATRFHQIEVEDTAAARGSCTACARSAARSTRSSTMPGARRATAPISSTRARTASKS